MSGASAPALIHARDLTKRFGEFTALRDRLDPDRVFGNDYLRRVLGP